MTAEPKKKPVGCPSDALHEPRAKASKPRESEICKPYEPTEREKKALAAQSVRRWERKPSPRFKVEDKAGVASISPDHPDTAIGSTLMMETLGTSDSDFFSTLMVQMAEVAATDGRIEQSKLNFMLAVAKSIEPRDELEAMLATQMAAVHTATMTLAKRLAHAENIPQQDSAERAFNKLARTFTVQIEALKHYRTGGEQKVTVEHVTVNAGGQAIVGNVKHGGREENDR